MTQKSYFWDIATVGDGQANYSDDELALATLLMFNYDRTKAVVSQEGIRADLWDSVVPSVIIVRASGGNFIIEEGTVGLVDGRLWKTDADITLVPGSGNGYYAVVIRRDLTGGAGDQTVRAALIYNAGSAPTPTQTAATWECVLAQGQVVAGVAQIDSYEFVSAPRHFNVSLRDGADRRDWSYPETVLSPELTLPNKMWSIDHPQILVGSHTHTPTASAASILIRFPEAFQRNHVPLVFVTPINLSGNTPSHSYVIRVSDISNERFTIQVDDDTDILGFYWMAVGPEETDPNYF